MNDNIPHIDAYRFGKITVNGQVYLKDLFICPDGVNANWRRKKGHSLCPQDLHAILEYHPKVLIVGCGRFGFLKIPEKTAVWITDSGIELISASTPEACNRYNELAPKTPTIAGLHLTC